MKKCVLVNCFASSNEMRVEPIREYFDNHGFKTVYLASDFHHAKKEYVQLPEDEKQIHVRKYTKNLSIARLLSHYEFSQRVYKALIGEKPDVVYIKFPPNSLVRIAFKYKKQHPNCKVILDVFDLWPESLPIPHTVKKLLYPFTSFWAALRNRYLSKGDIVLTECDMYRYALNKYLPEKVSTLYLMKNDIPLEKNASNDTSSIDLCYLGGINNLIDIDKIETILKEFTKKKIVNLHIIGDGVKRGQFINMAENCGCKVHYYGVIFDEIEKNEIMAKCTFGINIMKDDIMVALTIKSIEYFRAGLVLINNIKFDTWDLIEKYQAGINVDNNCNICFDKLNKMNITQMRNSSRQIFSCYFSEKAFEKSFDKIYYELWD